MKLAVRSAVAFRERGGDLYEQPEQSAGLLRWWRGQGAAGVVFYDATPDFYRTPPERFRRLKATLDDAGLPVAAFNALRKSLFMPELADYDQGRLDHCLAVCEVLRPAIFDVSVNVPIPVGLDPLAMAARPLFRGDFAGGEAFARAAARLKPVARACAALGAELSIELHDDGLHDTADNCLRLVELIGEPNVGVNPDVGNWYRVPYQHPDSWRDQVVKLAPKTNYWEVKNYKRILVPSSGPGSGPGEGRAYSWTTELDAGDIDFREAAVILWRAGFRGWVAPEGGNADPIRSTLNYLAYMRWVLDEWLPLVGEA